VSEFPEIDAAADEAFDANPGTQIKGGTLTELRRLLPAGDEARAA
jgi:hypothetical protein